MTTARVECLNCGESRIRDARPRCGASAGCCSRCGYVGWAPAAALDERVRRNLRERPPRLRRTLVLA